MEIVYGVESAVSLPDPEWQDTITDDGDMTLHQAMDGSLITYVKSSSNVRLDFSILMEYSSFLTLRTYIINAGTSQITLTWHDGDQYLGHFVTNPITFDTVKRLATIPEDTSSFDTEYGRIDLQFEGVKL